MAEWRKWMTLLFLIVAGFGVALVMSETQYGEWVLILGGVGTVIFGWPFWRQMFGL